MYHPLPINLLASLVRKKKHCVILDNARPGREQRYSLLFTEARHIIRCATLHEVRQALERVSQEAQRHWVAGYLAYEAAYGLEEKFSRMVPALPSFQQDLLWFGVFDEPHIFDHLSGTWNSSPPCDKKRLDDRGAEPKSVKAPYCSRNIDKSGYIRALETIKALIAAGDVYQVNFTFDVTVETDLDPWNFYRALRAEQPVPFGAFIQTGSLTVASLSPELFFMRKGSHIQVRPMKGTAPRGRYRIEDKKIAHTLPHDSKNRSENVMIVDLLRNDLGKICRTGSIKVERLFEVERHPTLHQMTSTISGRLRATTSLGDIMSALFPSGSVTGAPKIRAMEIIHGLEKGQRGIYCGAIGYASPRGRVVFSVPIRTLRKERGATGWHYGVGSGIVWDSVAENEWRECANKCEVLTSTRREFMIFESMLVSRGAVRYVREHGTRMAGAAAYFDVPFQCAAWNRMMEKIGKRFQRSSCTCKVRVFLNRKGGMQWDFNAITPLSPDTRCRVLLSAMPIDERSPFLFHKTTFRPWYEEAMRLIRKGLFFDVIHTNSHGQLTEGTRSNIFVKIKGTLYTPPIECGLLPGILRQRMLKRKKCCERILRPSDLKRAEALFCGNSVRGLVRITVD